MASMPVLMVQMRANKRKDWNPLRRKKYSGLRTGIQFTKPFHPTAPVRCSMCVNDLFQFKLATDEQRTIL